MITRLKVKRREFLNYYRSQKTSQTGNIKLYNWCIPPAQQDFWLAQFIESKKILPEKKTLALFSVFGLRSMMFLNQSDYKIFVARENVHRPNWIKYSDLCLKSKWVDLSVGFDYIAAEKYIRFPLWLMWIFKPTDTYKDIKQFCQRVNDADNSSFDNRKFCSFLSSHDDFGRREIYNDLSRIDRVDCDGRLFHNNDELKNEYADDKLAYLKQYRFNLCPENSNSPGYCTEKIFEAISSGCVPLYWGADLCPEPDILNHNAIVFTGLGCDNTAQIELIKKLNINKEQYLEFARQPRLLPNAPDVIWEYFELLEKQLKIVFF